MSNPNIASRFDEIYNSTSKAVLTYITVRCGCVADIDDIFQETYLELCQLMSKRGAEYVTNEKALVLRIAKQKISKYYKFRERVRNLTASLAFDEDGDKIDISELEADAFLTEDFVVNQMLLEDARLFIIQKPEIVKKVYYLFYDVGLTIPEIAKELSISESSVKNKLYRTLKELRNLLNRKGELL